LSHLLTETCSVPMLRDIGSIVCGV